MQKSRELIELEIESLAGTGEGVGRHSGAAVFVSFTAPGDRILADVGPVGQGRRRGRLVRVVEAGPHRVKPPCNLFGLCGGCAWLCCSYESQVEAKSNHARRAFRVAGGGDPSLRDVEVTVERAKNIYGYRRKARLHWEKSADGVAIGFMNRGGCRIVDLGDGGSCVVLRSAILGVVGSLREVIGLSGAPAAGEVSVLVGAQNRIHLAFFPCSRRSAKRRGKRAGGRFTGAARNKCEELVSSGLVVGMVFAERKCFSRLGEDSVFLEEGPAKSISPDSEVVSESAIKGSAACFVQANAEMNERIRKTVRGIDVLGPVLELYAGIGNFTMDFLSSERVTAAEIDETACKLLKRNAARAGCGSRIRVLNEDASSVVDSLISDGELSMDGTPGLVLVDPPRAGCGKLIRSLAGLGSSKILYISCDAMTCARDVARLMEGGYRIMDIRGYDTMPHTAHFELVVLMEKKSTRDAPE